MVVAGYVVTCWNCLGEFEALGAVWCSDDPKNPTKLCPFCLRCFCEASSDYKRQFWRSAPAQLVDERGGGVAPELALVLGARIAEAAQAEGAELAGALRVV